MASAPTGFPQHQKEHPQLGHGGAGRTALQNVQNELEHCSQSEYSVSWIWYLRKAALQDTHTVTPDSNPQNVDLYIYAVHSRSGAAVTRARTFDATAWKQSLAPLVTSSVNFGSHAQSALPQVCSTTLF